MQEFYIITNGVDGGFSTIRFNDREAVIVYEDKALALSMMKHQLSAALVELELDSRQQLADELGSFLTAEERARIEFLFPDADEYWPLIKQLQ